MSASETARPATPFPLSASVARTAVGAVRQTNEDCFLDRPDLGLWVVADGMGGHQRGEVASRMIVDALNGLPHFASGHAFLGAVRATLQQTNLDLIDQARALGGDAVVGSTVVALLAFDGHFACVWAGDSRAYRVRDGRLEQITRDHSLVQEMVERGEITQGQARVDRRGNIVTRAVGVREGLELELAYGPLEPNDVFLLCSDGLTGALADDDLLELINAAGWEGAADRLLDLALERGAADNVTLVLVGAGGG